MLAERGLLATAPAGVFAQAALNAFIASGRSAWSATRARLSDLLRDDVGTLRDDAPLRARALVPMANAQMHLPVDVPGLHRLLFVEGARDQRRLDVSRSEERAAAELARDPDRLQRARELGRGERHAGAPPQRPAEGARCARAQRSARRRKLDIELETGFIVGRGNALGTPIAVADAEAHIFGMVLLNDWSARDIQTWEYVPLGPFNSKTFATSISPWLVTLEALEPFRVAGPAQDPGAAAVPPRTPARMRSTCTWR